MAKKKAAVREDGPELIRFCAHANTTEDVRDSRWDAASLAGGLGWVLTGDLPNFTRAALAAECRRSFARISQVCGLTFFEASGNANIIIGSGPIDGPSGILAQCMLPPANPVQMLIDVSERWNASINLLPVILHELGHGVGMQHDPQRGALLSAFYDAAIQDYQSRDIQRLQALYGPPVSKPPPDPDPVNKIVLEVTNADSLRLINALTGKEAKVTWPA